MSAEQVDPFSPLGRQVLNEVNAKNIEPGQPGWIAPGEMYMLANPVEMGFIAVNKIIKFDPEIAQDGQW